MVLGLDRSADRACHADRPNQGQWCIRRCERKPEGSDPSRQRYCRRQDRHADEDCQLRLQPSGSQQALECLGPLHAQQDQRLLEKPRADEIPDQRRPVDAAGQILLEDKVE
jgi:hypothetical protein